MILAVARKRWQQGEKKEKKTFEGVWARYERIESPLQEEHEKERVGTSQKAAGKERRQNGGRWQKKRKDIIYMHKAVSKISNEIKQID